MADQKLNIWVALQDKISSGLTKIRNKFASFSKTMSTGWQELAAKVYLFRTALRAVTAVISPVIEAAIRQEDATKRLGNAIELQGIKSTEVLNMYKRISAEMQASTRYGNEAIEETMQQLISVGGATPDIMERATKAAVDFAAATGRDLSTAALTVGKALTGFTGELSRYGIILDENIPKTEKARAALEAMERQFGGFAQKDVDSFAGKVAQLSNAWGDFLEELGGFITQSPIVENIIVGWRDIFMQASKYLKDVNKNAESNAVNNLRAELERLDKVIENLRNQQKRGGLYAEKHAILERQINDELIRRERVTRALLAAQSKAAEELGKIVVEGGKPKNEQKTIAEWIGFEAEDMKKFGEQAASNLQNAFSEFFFKAFKGEFRSLKDVISGFGDALLQLISQMMAMAALKKIFTGTKLGGFLGFQAGTPFVPQTGLYMLHRGEQVVPAHQTGGGGGNVTINVNQAITAWDATDVYRNRKALAQGIAQEIRSNGEIRNVIKQYA